MKQKFTLKYFFAFISLLFLFQEIHDWAHFLVSKFLCGCTGIKNFDYWTICDSCDISSSLLFFVWIAGPLVTFIIVWLARNLMKRSNSLERRSVGFSMLFAASPFIYILASAQGGGDFALALKALFPGILETNHRLISLMALSISLILIVPPFLKSMKLVKDKKERLLIYPLFIILPPIIKYIGLDVGMTKLLKMELLDEDIFTGIPLLVIVWHIVLIIVLFFSYRSLPEFFQKEENEKPSRHHQHSRRRRRHQKPKE